MSALSNIEQRTRSGMLRLLDAPVCVGRQLGEPVEVRVRDLLLEAPSFLVIAAMVGALIFI